VRSSLAGTEKVPLFPLHVLNPTLNDRARMSVRGHRAFLKKHSAKDGLAGAALIQNNACVVKSAQVDPMKISDIACPSCGSLYLVAESISASAGPGHANCSVCGKLLDSWQQSRMRVYRLELPPELKYPRVEPSPSP
jgi:hypothetical protein